jgi:hypothetical protein
VHLARGCPERERQDLDGSEGFEGGDLRNARLLLNEMRAPDRDWPIRAFAAR